MAEGKPTDRLERDEIEALLHSTEQMLRVLDVERPENEPLLRAHVKLYWMRHARASGGTEPSDKIPLEKPTEK